MIPLQLAREMRHRLFIVLLCFDMVLVLLCVADSLGWVRLTLAGDLLVVCGGLIQLPFMLYIGRQARAEKHARLGRCTACGYNLTGNTSGVCPECGTAVAENTEVAV